MITKETFVELRDFFANTLKKLKGSDKRTFCAELALSIGHGGQSLVAKELGVSRKTICKGIPEVKSGIVCLDAYNLRHRPPIEKTPTSVGRHSIHFGLPKPDRSSIQDKTSICPDNGQRA